MINPGSVVLCVDTSDYIAGRPGEHPPLRKGAEYVVQEIQECACGRVGYDVGLSSSTPIGTLCLCGRHFPNPSIWYCSSRRFVEKKVEHNVSFTKKVVEEPLFSEN